MRFRKKLLVSLVVISSFSTMSAFSFPGPEVSSTLAGCDLPPAEAKMWPASGNPIDWAEFVRRDNQNQFCATQRGEDQFRHDELQEKYRDMTLPSYAATLQSQLAEPNRPRLSTAQWFPGMKLADPYRVPERWSALTGGSVRPFSFIANKNGAKLVGDLFIPPGSIPGSHPGVIFANGGSQHFRQLYFWLAQGLAEEGYLVMTFDFQGQGGSEYMSHQKSGSYCTEAACLKVGLLAEETYDVSAFYDQMRDAIGFFLSSPTTPYGSSLWPNYAGTDLFNPAHAVLDRSKVGVAGHSIGSLVSNDIGQQDQRIKAIVRYGHFGYISPGYDDAAHAPTLIVNDEYGSKGPQPWFTLPDPTAWEHGYNQLVSKQLPAMMVQLRSSTHFEWTYSPGRYASRYGERVSFHYTLAWFDAFLKGITNDALRDDAYKRLTALTFDDSADIHSIGAGTYERDAEGDFRNVPYVIAGKRVKDRISYMLRSMYWLRAGGLTCSDMRTGDCPGA